MGQPKQLMPLDGEPMVRRVAASVCAAGLAQVVAVIGAHAAQVRQALVGLDLKIVLNEAWAAGLSTSLRAGIEALQPGTQAVLIVLADQPSLTPILIQTLVARYRATGALIVAPFYQGQRGNPVLFDRACFPELLALEGDRGARGLLSRYRERVEPVDTKDPAVILDVDTRQDYQKLRETGIGP
jgi:molybdenum cofactor cytidylyltransferase